MHAASLKNSDRLKRVASLLKSGRPYTTMEIIKRAQVCAVNSIVAELRANGMDIVCNRLGNVWMYRRQ